MEDIEFLLDESLEERKRDFEEISKALKATKPKNENALVLREFTKALIKASAKEEKFKKSVLKPEAMEMLKKPILQEQPVLQTPLMRKVKIALPKPFLPRPPPMPVIKPRVEGIKKVKVEKPKKEIKLEKQYPLILDKVTNKTLAAAIVNKEYKLIEPELSEVDLKILNKVKKKIGKKTEKIIGDEDLLIENIKKVIKHFKVEYSEDLVRKVRYYFIRDLLNFGKIDPLLQDDNISLISCSAVGEFVNVIHRGNRLRTNIIFENKNELDSLIKKMGEKTNQKISEKEPVLDAVFDGHKFQATFGIGTVSSKFVITKV